MNRVDDRRGDRRGMLLESGRRYFSSFTTATNTKVSQMDSQNAKTVADFLTADFQHEMGTTERVLAAVPPATSTTGQMTRARPAWVLFAILLWKTSGC